MRLIDADALRHSHCVECTLYPYKCLGKDCDWGSIYHIDHAPTVDAEPVRHGKWYVIPLTTLGKNPITFRMYRCSECKSTAYEKTPYCAKCGAKMDGRKKVRNLLPRGYGERK